MRRIKSGEPTVESLTEELYALGAMLFSKEHGPKAPFPTVSMKVIFTDMVTIGVVGTDEVDALTEIIKRRELELNANDGEGCEL